MRRITAIATAATVLIVIQTAWTQQKAAEERLAAARERLQVRSLRSAIQSFYRSLDNDDTEAATGQVAKVKKLWEALDADLQGKIEKSRPGTGQRVADLESECSLTAAPATSQPASQPAPAATSDVKALPTSRPAADADDSIAPPRTELARMGERAPAGKLAVRSSVVKEAGAAEPQASGPWRPQYANDYDIFGDHPKGRCEKYKGAAEEPVVPRPATPAAPAGAPRSKVGPAGKEGGSIDQIIKGTPIKKTPKPKK